MKTATQLFKVLSMLLVLLVLSNCSDDPAADPEPEQANLTDFFETVPEWETFSPQIAAQDVASGEPVADGERTDIEGTQYNCSSTSYSLTETPDKVTTLNPDVEVLYVGSLLQGDGHLNGIGSLAELPIRQRAPITITLDLLTGANNRVVEAPDVSTVNMAIGELINDAQNAGHKAGSNIFYKSETTHSFTQVSLKMGLSASYMGASIKASLSSNLSEDKRTVTAYFIQQMFTASMVLPQYPEDVFTNEFTQELLDREVQSGRMSEENPPVYVSSIVYGRIMMFSFTSTSTEAKIKATLNAVYNAGEFGGELSTDLQKVLDEAEISVVTVGGDADHALSLIRANNLSEFFASDSPLSTAKPISYTIRNLKDNAVARVSETTSYNLRECTVSDPTGYEFKFQLTKIKGIAFPDLEPVLDYAADVYYEFKIKGTTDVIVAKTYFGSAPPYQIYPEAVAEGEEIEVVQWVGGILDPWEPSPAVEGLKVHLDGRDEIKVHGTLWDYDGDLNADDPFPFNREFEGPTLGNLNTDGQVHEFSTDSKDQYGNIFRLFGTYQRTGVLFD